MLWRRTQATGGRRRHKCLDVLDCFFESFALDAQKFFLSCLLSWGWFVKANLLQMNMQSMVVYDASQGYDEDTWDDSALIKAYDLAKESSRCSVSWSPYSTDTDFSSLDIYICQLSRRWQPSLSGCKKFEPSLRLKKSSYGWFIFRIGILYVWEGRYWRGNDKKRLKTHQNGCFFHPDHFISELRSS